MDCARERSIYTSDWVGLSLVDVEIPGHERFDHHVVRVPSAAAGTVVHDEERGVLLLWQHRFITDTWGWEIPAGGIDPGETPAAAAERETIEETGWKPGPLTHLTTYHPSNGLSDQEFHLFLAQGASELGQPVDTTEAERIEWMPVDQLPEIILQGEITDGLSLVGIMMALQFHNLSGGAGRMNGD